jgi:hypothetical protein
MPRDFFDPAAEQQNVTLIDAATLHAAKRLIESCEACHPDDADIPFELDSGPRYRIRSERDGLHSGRAGEVSELSSRESRKDVG